MGMVLIVSSLGLREMENHERNKLPTSRDAFYQAITLNEILGRYFSFSRAKISEQALLEQERRKRQIHNSMLPEDRQFEIFFDPSCGVPGPLAYRIWTGLEKIVSDYGYGYVFPKTLILSTRQLLQISDRSYSGAAAKEVALAISQLEKTSITYWSEDPTNLNSNGVAQIREESFSLIKPVSIVRERKKSSPHLFRISIHPNVWRFIDKDGNYFCMSWQRINDLLPPCQVVARYLFRYMSYRYSKSNTKKFHYLKDYSTMCCDWFGGLSPYSRQSEIVRKHLSPRLDPLVSKGILSGYNVCRNKGGTGFNICFHPGKQFFLDFDHFYRKRPELICDGNTDENQSNLSPEVPDGDVIILLQHFCTAWFGAKTEYEFLATEYNFAQALVSEFSIEECKRFVDWAIGQARNTGFDIQTINALKQYLRSWRTESEKRTARVTREADELNARRDKEAEEEYEKYCTLQAQRYIDSLEIGEREQLTEVAKEQLMIEYPEVRPLGKGLIRARERVIVRKLIELQPRQQWLAENRNRIHNSAVTIS